MVAIINLMKNFLYILLLLSTSAVHAEDARKFNHKIVNCSVPMGQQVMVEEKVCPLDDGKFKALVSEGYSSDGQYLDLQPISNLKSPVPVPVCPDNGFVMYKDNFSDKEIAEIKLYITSPEYDRLFRHKQASYFLLYKLNQNVDLDRNYEAWRLALQASWEAYGCGDTEKYHDYVYEAIKSGTNALRSMNKSDDDYLTLKILIPNLYRRIGHFSNARKWLDKLEDDDLPIEAGQRNSTLTMLRLLNQAIEERNSDPIKVR